MYNQESLLENSHSTLLNINQQDKHIKIKRAGGEIHTQGKAVWNL